MQAEPVLVRSVHNAGQRALAERVLSSESGR
jgi:hypothetical protein